MPPTMKPISCYHYLLLLFASEIAAGSSSPVSAILVFGDSTVDPGNNNFVATPFKSNFLPYGQDFVNHTPTGRFTNGRLPNDFVASYLGIKELLPPYLDPTLSIEELMTGVSFASAGSGFDPLTPTISNVIPMGEQLKYFKEYRAKMEAAIGKERTEKVIGNAVFVVSGGTNDFVLNYFMTPIRRRTYTLPNYIRFIVHQTRHFLQELMEEGGRRIGVVGLPPMGCLPVVITLFSDNPILNRDCIEGLSWTAREYNRILQEELSGMQLQVEESGFRIAYLDIYAPLQEIITLGTQYGFENVNRGCCGTGTVEATFMCNPTSRVCEDAAKYVFWDSIHPTQRSYQLVFEALRPVIDHLIRTT